MDDRMTCPMCGADQPATARYCRVCGGSLSGEETPRSGFESLALLELRVNDLQQQIEGVDQRLHLVEVGAHRSAPLSAVTQLERPVAAPRPAVSQLERPAAAPRPIIQGPTPAPGPAPVREFYKPVVVHPAVKPTAAREAATPGEIATAPLVMPAFSAAAEPEQPRRWPSPVAKAPRDWEQFLSGQGMAIVGGLAIVIGAVFFLSLAFSRGWIGPEARIVIGLVAATALIGAGWRQFVRKLDVMAHVLTAAGMGVMMLSLFASTRLYDLAPIELALLGSLITATAAALIAIKFDTQVVAAFGIVSALAAPPILGAEANGTTIAFMATALAGTTLIALYRTWNWLPHLAFALSAPQLTSWIATEPAVVAGAIAVGGFWLLHAVAAGGEEFRRPTSRLRLSSALLLGMNSLTAVGLTYLLFDFGDRPGMPFMLFALASAHLALGVWFLTAHGDRHPFGMLATGGGIATTLLAVSEQFDGVVVAVIWTVVALIVAWFAARLRNPFGAAAAGVAGALIFAHIWVYEYPLSKLDEVAERTPPFLNAEGATLAAVLAGLAFAGWIARRRDIRIVALNAGALLLFTALPHELSGQRLLLAWITLFAVASVIGSRNGLLGIPGATPSLLNKIETSAGGWTAWIPAVAATVLAFGHLWQYEYPFSELATTATPDRPFLHLDAALAGLLLLTLLLSGWISRHLTYRIAQLVAGTALVITVLPHELSGLELLAAWCGLIVIGAAIERNAALFGHEPVIKDAWANPVALFRRLGIASTWGAGSVLAFGLLALAPLPYGDLVNGSWIRPDRPFINLETGAALLLAGASMAAALIARHVAIRRASVLIAFAALAYMMPFQLGAAAAVVAWSALAVLLSAITMWDARGVLVYRVGSGVLLGSGAIWTFTAIAPPERLVVDAGRMAEALPLWSPASLALGGLAAALAILARREQMPAIRRSLAILAGVITVYLLSVAVVDHFQQQVGGETSLDSLQKQAQVGLSVLWAVLGGVTFAAGALTERKPIRLFALALLGLATAKVFILDLASLNASYRVPSFIALGVLLLASSYIYQRHRARHLPRNDEDDQGGADKPPPVAGAATGMPA